jgi:transcriptional regulator with XRE-family HTH domain
MTSSHGDGRSFTPAQNEKLREIAAKLLADRYSNNRSEFARKLGVSGAALSNFLNSVTGAGTKLAAALAHELGMSLPEIIGVASGDAASRRPIYGNLDGLAKWSAWLIEQKTIKPEHEAIARRMSGLRVPEPVTMEFVLEMCRLAERFDSPEIQAAAESETEKFRRRVERDKARGPKSTTK